MAKKNKKRNVKSPKKKKKNIKSIIVSCVVVLVIAAAVVTAYIIYQNTSLDAADFSNSTFVCSSARDASGDEADMSDVYNLRYDNYQGSLKLSGDGSFEFWMSPGTKDDGVHAGTYTYNREKQVLNAKFDNGEKVNFKLVRGADGGLKRIEAPYNGYTVSFVKSEE